MNDEHFIVLGVARPRTTWLADLVRWSTSSMLPIEFIRCVSVDEVRARLLSDRRHSAVLLGEGCTGVDRDIIEIARDAKCAPIIVTDGEDRRDWTALGAACSISQPITPDDVLTAVREHAIGFERRSLATLDLHRDLDDASQPTARLITVLGAGGTGTSTTAMALAAHFAERSDAPADPSHSPVALIDASLDADLARLHDLGDVVPGLQELVDLHRLANPSIDQVRSHLWFAPRHGYDVLPGLRRHRDWTALRRRATLASFASIRRSYRLVVADTDADLEGQTQTGSIDVEDRNLLARELTTSADVVVLTIRSGVTGTSRALRILLDLDELGVDPRRILIVAIGAPRSTRQRSELTRTIATLAGELLPTSTLPTPVMIPIRRDLEPFIHDSAPPPRAAFGSISSAVEGLLRSLPVPEPVERTVEIPIPIVPGHLGRTA